jgi:hypothetical protein
MRGQALSSLLLLPWPVNKKGKGCLQMVRSPDLSNSLPPKAQVLPLHWKQHSYCKTIPFSRQTLCQYSQAGEIWTKAFFIWTFLKQKLRSCGENKECGVVSVSGKSEVSLQGESDSITETLNIKRAIQFGQWDALQKHNSKWRRRVGAEGSSVAPWSVTTAL